MTPLLAQKLRVDRGFERMYRRHLGDVYRYTLAVLRNPADAEDVTQTTFLNAYRAFARGERPRNPQNWLIAIAHNVCRQRFRQQQRRPDEISYEDGIGDVVPEEEPGASAEDIQRALGHLAFNQRAALVMRELEGRSYAEIAEILGLSVGAVETLIFRARRALREQLEGSLTCAQAERAISLQLDGKLPRADRGPLRAHLRECPECERLARSLRAQRTAWKGLALIPIPTSLTSLFGGGGAVGAGLGAKAAAVVAAGTVATGVGVEASRLVETTAPVPVAVQTSSAAPSTRPERPVASSARARQVTQSAAAKAATRASKAALPGPAVREAKPMIAPGQAKKTATAAASAAPATPPGRAKAVTRVKPTKSPARATPTPRSKPPRERRPQAQGARSEAPKAPKKRAGKAKAGPPPAGLPAGEPAPPPPLVPVPEPELPLP